MKRINEDFLHFLWKNQHLSGVTYISDDNLTIEVLDPGMHNLDAGPDFFNARVMINGTLWAGNVELHLNASDWMKHGHEQDPAYDSVILHVVYFNDCKVSRTNGEYIPTIVLRFPSLMWDKYSGMMNEKSWIPCAEELRKVAPVHIAQWTSSLMIEKLLDRSQKIAKHLDDLNNHWDALLSRMLFRGFGLPVNTTPFEILSLSVPYTMLIRNKSSIFSLEAILLGQAGMLQKVIPQDIYMESLKTEFSRFEARMESNYVPSQAWKYLRMRPASFPSLRIAQLAALIHHRYPMFPFLESMPSRSEILEKLRIRAGDYWNTHYQPGKPGKSCPKYLGHSFSINLIINAITPYLFFFGKQNKQQKFCDYAIHLLEDIPPEHNAILKKWGKFGMSCRNAFESQAYLHLYKNYCIKKQCLRCQYGNLIIINGKNKE